MASIFTSTFDMPIRVRRAADLLNAAEAVPVGLTERAA